jgi:hypothetical protein
MSYEHKRGVIDNSSRNILHFKNIWYERPSNPNGKSKFACLIYEIIQFYNILSSFCIFVDIFNKFNLLIKAIIIEETKLKGGSLG